jgi:toxin ParE1/3/4
LAQVAWTLEAERWLRDIYDYIAADSTSAATSTVSGIVKKAQILSQFPELGFRYDTGDDRSVRVLLYGHYRIVYLTKTDGNIDILGVFHAALDIDRLLA